jgi:hypothetical protein
MENIIKNILRKFGYILSNRNAESSSRELFLNKYDVKINRALLESSYPYI